MNIKLLWQLFLMPCCAEGRHLRAHKIILSACSPYFKQLFIENYEKHPIIILHDVKYDVLKAFMDFMYRGELNVPQEQLTGVLKLSESLRVRGLSGSGLVDDVKMQKGCGRNAQSVPVETIPSHPIPSHPILLLCHALPQVRTSQKGWCSHL
ncbi:longitudinals lacking protein, isoforms H/M/V-like [Schistocerca gregaria]|uniref:longitudinals lacking protein, isoforms H/M/V-like n=1 Tax=Schistocerca gregaria TaxID=7010 RepID=UPI00211EEF02|nr:longitudinals lacking protein, isoforms H/M/V-like [Schistocerca gregaria]